MGFLTWELFRVNTQFKTFIYYEPETGQPYVKGEGQKMRFERELPERFRQFALMNGNFLWPYFKSVDRKYGTCRADVALLLEYFPTWENIKDSEEFDELTKNGWDEAKHNLFKECLEWCKEQKGFWGEWPY